MQPLQSQIKKIPTYDHWNKTVGLLCKLTIFSDDNIKFYLYSVENQNFAESEFFTIEKIVQFLSDVSVKCYHYSV